MKHGFDLAFIDKGLEEMWNAQLDYSDYDAALTFLLQMQQREQDEPVGDDLRQVETCPVEKQSETPNLPVVPTKSDTKSTVSTTSSYSCAKEGTPGNPVKNTIISPESECTSKKVLPNHAEKLKKKKTRKTQSEATLQSKLEIVANHESLSDSITALTEWIVKAASKSEVRIKLHLDMILP